MLSERLLQAQAREPNIDSPGFVQAPNSSRGYTTKLV